MNRRRFFSTATVASAGSFLAGQSLFATDAAEQEKSQPQGAGLSIGGPLYKISLAQWSLHRLLQAGKLTNLDFPKYTKEKFDIDALEYVNQFFMDKAKDQAYLKELNQRVGDLGMTNVLIMVDKEGIIGEDTAEGREKTVEKHKKWVEAAKTLGCHAIRVNAYGKGSAQEAADRVVEGLHKLASFAVDFDIAVIVENHGSLSSDGKWLSGVLKRVNLINCGSLPDFGNFYEYDRYQGIDDLMPYAHGVSAKSHDFNEAGDEIHTDFYKAMDLVLYHGYHGYVGIEYGGTKISEDEGVLKTKQLLEKIRKQRSA